MNLKDLHQLEMNNIVYVDCGTEDRVKVIHQSESVWHTQKAMAQLFDCSMDNIGLHQKKYLNRGNFRKIQLSRNTRQMLPTRRIIL